MQIIIPMSGIGQRFVDAGYTTHKALLQIEGKALIEHVVELFPGESQFIFICNEVHLHSTDMGKILTRIVPEGKIVSIPGHKLGPVFAVSQVFEHIDPHDEVIVNYCDFGTFWDYSDFLQHTRSRMADGAIAAYRGFHPHMLGTTNYAFIREQQQWLQEIREKQPFTENRMDEYASNGSYYFRTGAILKTYFQQLMDKKISLNGEYYVSLVYNLMHRDGLRTSIYAIQHMLQWGTPQDVEEYVHWSHYFRRAIEPQPVSPAITHCTNIIPMAGQGQRFLSEGFETPKPLIDVAGKPMVIQACAHLPKPARWCFVCQQEHLKHYALEPRLKDVGDDIGIVPTDGLTAGQAISCELGLDGIADEDPILIAACDNGMLWQQDTYQALIENEHIDAIVWTFRGHPATRRHPEMYGWVACDHQRVTRVSVKVPISSNPQCDHAIVGTFFFRRSQLFREGLDYLRQKDERVNGEFYVDSVIGALVHLGYQVAIFEVDAYIGWGTPDDLRTYRYWQSFFDATPSHPYRLQLDRFVNQSAIEAMRAQHESFAQEFR